MSSKALETCAVFAKKNISDNTPQMTVKITPYSANLPTRLAWLMLGVVGKAYLSLFSYSVSRDRTGAYPAAY